MKTGPAGARIELGIRGKKFELAADADVRPLGLAVPVLAGEGPLGVFLASYLELFRGEQLTPLGIRSFAPLVRFVG